MAVNPQTKTKQQIANNAVNKIYRHPIALILIAGISAADNQQLQETLKADEYLFANSTDWYNLLELAECSHPKAAIVDFATIEHKYLEILQFLKLLQIPAIVISDELEKNMIQYLSLIGVFATLKKTDSESELRRALAMAAYPEHLDAKNGRNKSRSWDLSTMKGVKQTKVQDVVGRAIGLAVSQVSEMIHCGIEHDDPSSQALSPLLLQQTLNETLGENKVAVAQLDFSGDLYGSAQMLFSQEAADKIVLALNGGGDVSSEQFKKDKADIMGEIGNVAINGLVGTFSNTLKYDLGYVVPHYVEGPACEIFSKITLSPRDRKSVV